MTSDKRGEKTVCCQKCTGYFQHRVGSHSDDWGGDSDRDCDCNENECKKPNCECHSPLQEPREKKYPCSDCGKLRTKAEGGTTFTVCDKCWDKKHSPQPEKTEKPEGECNRLILHECSKGIWDGKIHFKRPLAPQSASVAPTPNPISSKLVVEKTEIEKEFIKDGPYCLKEIHEIWLNEDYCRKVGAVNLWENVDKTELFIHNLFQSKGLGESMQKTQNLCKPMDKVLCPKGDCGCSEQLRQFCEKHYKEMWTELPKAKIKLINKKEFVKLAKKVAKSFQEEYKYLRKTELKREFDNLY